jgi:hypothetical protein
MALSCKHCGVKLAGHEMTAGVCEYCVDPATKKQTAIASIETTKNQGTAPEAPSSMRCAKCKAAAVKRHPQDWFGRHAGYYCTQCRALMRRPHSIGDHVSSIVICIIVLLLCVGAGYLGLSMAAPPYGKMLGLVGLMLTVFVNACWDVHQLCLPIPLDSPPRRIRVRKVFLFLLVLFGILMGFYLLRYFLPRLLR